MESVTYTEARNNLKEVLDVACEGEDILVSRKAGQHCVVMSLEKYNSMMETAHLLSTPENAKRLIESIEQLAKSKGK